MRGLGEDSWGPASSETLLVTFLGSAVVTGTIFLARDFMAAFTSCHVGPDPGALWGRNRGLWTPLVLPGPEAGTEWAQAWFPWVSDTLGRASHLLSKSGGGSEAGLGERIPSVGPLEGGLEHLSSPWQFY